jgi:hypothetical protein
MSCTREASREESVHSTPIRRSPIRTRIPAGGLILALAAGAAETCAGADTPVSAAAGVTASLRRASASALMLEASLPAGSYAVVERSIFPSRDFAPLTIVLPTDPKAFRAAVPMDSTGAGAVFRLRVMSQEAPGDADGDGMDDLYELRRGQILDPLDASDALRDGDGDGDSNLTEYLSLTESAPPRTDAPTHYATFAELTAAAELPLPPMVHLGGHDKPGDGWGGWFAWREDDERAADGALVVEIRPGARGRLERIVEAGDAVHTAWWRPPADGKTDAGPRLQRAFAFMASRPLRNLIIDPGLYRLEARIAYSDPTQSPLSLVGVEDFTVDGTGATLVTSNDGEMLMLANCRRGTVRNLSIQGAGSDRSLPDGNYTAIALVGSQSDLLFSRCSVRGFMHGLSHLHGEKTSVRVTVRECRFEDGSDFGHGTLGGDGAAISGIGDDWLVENCFFHECGRGIEIENTAKDLPITRVNVRGNRLTNVRNLGIVAWLGGGSSDLDHQSDIVVRDNLVVGKSPRHIDPRGHVVPIINISINGGSRWIVQGNICYNGDFAGISLYSNQAPIADCVVSGNVVGDIGGRGIQIYTTPALRTRGIVVSNNRISACYDPGILITGEHVVAQGNLIENTAVGISVGNIADPFLPASHVVIRGNTFRRMPAGFPAIVLAPAAVDYVVADNDVSAADIGIRDLSERGVIEGNRFADVALEIELPNE